MTSKIRAYQSTSTLGMSQVDLILKVYDGAIAAYSEAAEFYQKGNNNSGYDKLERAKKFVTHLYTTLDPKNGGDIADKLGKIYAFLLNQTNVAQATKDLKIIDDNITVLGNIREGWQGLKVQQKSAGPKEATSEEESKPIEFLTTA